jgi:hypothetical protein
MKLQIEVHVPEDFDAEHAIRTANDALGVSDNVSAQEWALVNYFLCKVKESLDAAKPKMKKFNVIYYGVIEAVDGDVAASVAVAARPSDKSFVGTAASYKYGSHDIKARE